MDSRVWGLMGKKTPLPCILLFLTMSTDDHRLLKFSKEGIEQPFTMNGFPVKQIAARHSRTQRSSVVALVGMFVFQFLRLPPATFVLPPPPANENNFQFNFKRWISSMESRDESSIPCGMQTSCEDSPHDPFHPSTKQTTSTS